MSSSLPLLNYLISSKSGIEIITVVCATAIGSMDLAQAWGLLFFGMLITFGLNSQVNVVIKVNMKYIVFNDWKYFVQMLKLT